MDFKTFNLKKDEDMYYKKAYNYVSYYVDIVKYTVIITVLSAIIISNKRLGLKRNYNEINITKIISLVTHIKIKYQVNMW